MKKLYILALALVASASSFAQLRTSSDSVSYAAGVYVTNGLVPFLVQQHQMDTTYMADFVRGFREAVKNDDPAMKAYLTGMSIAQQLNERMLPGVTKEFKDSPDSIIPNLFYDGFAAALLKDATHFTSEKAEQYFLAKREADKAAREEKLYGANRTAGRQFLEENAKKEGVITLPSGLQYKVLVHRSCPGELRRSPRRRHRVRCLQGSGRQTSRVHPHPGDQGLDRGADDDASGLEVATLHPL